MTRETVFKTYILKIRLQFCACNKNCKISEDFFKFKALN